MCGFKVARKQNKTTQKEQNSAQGGTLCQHCIGAMDQLAIDLSLIYTIEIFHLGCGKIMMGCCAKMRGNLTCQNFASILENKSFHVEVMVCYNAGKIVPNLIKYEIYITL